MAVLYFTFLQTARGQGRADVGRAFLKNVRLCAIGKRACPLRGRSLPAFFGRTRGRTAYFAAQSANGSAKPFYSSGGWGRGATAYCGRKPAPAQNMGNSPNLPKFSKKIEKIVVFLLTFGVGYGIVIRLSQESSSKTPDKRSDRRNLSKNFQKT